MEASRRRMQEELDAKAVVFREKQKEVSSVRKGGLSSGPVGPLIL